MLGSRTDSYKEGYAAGFMAASKLVVSILRKAGAGGLLITHINETQMRQHLEKITARRATESGAAHV